MSHGSPKTPLPLSPGVSPLREVLSLALPTVAQMASYTLMQFIDTWMLSWLGPVAPAAASNGGMLAFSFISFGMGLLFIVNALASQDYGAGKFSNCGRHLWQGVWFAIAYSIVIAPFVLGGPAIMSLFHHEADVTAMETIYFQITLGTAFIKLIQTAFSQFLLATNRPNIVMAAAFTGVSVNAGAAYVLIWGRLGIAQYGIAGAGWAQAIGVGTECVILICVAFAGSNRAKFGTTDFRLRWAELKTLVTVGFGTGVQFVVDVLAWSMFMMVVIGQFGEHAMAANAFMFRYLILSFMPALGISQAVTALVGRYVGMGKPDIAMKRADLGFSVTMVYLGACALLYIVGRRELIHFFADDAEVIRIGAVLMVFAAFYQFFDGMFIVYNGALRGVGDTFVPACMTAGLCWGLNVVGGYCVGRFYPQFGVAGPWTIATIYGVCLGLFMRSRFKNGRWIGKTLEAARSADSNNREDSAKLAGLGVGDAL